MVRLARVRAKNEPETVEALKAQQADGAQETKEAAEARLVSGDLRPKSGSALPLPRCLRMSHDRHAGLGV
jgi:hypothetical protein